MTYVLSANCLTRTPLFFNSLRVSKCCTRSFTRCTIFGGVAEGIETAFQKQMAKAKATKSLVKFQAINLLLSFKENCQKTCSTIEQLIGILSKIILLK